MEFPGIKGRHVSSSWASFHFNMTQAAKEEEDYKIRDHKK